MDIGLIIIGDEILSGKRQDKHFAEIQRMLRARGLALSWVSYLGDDRDRLTRVLRDSFARGGLVFSCGGIGATPDDHTRQAAGAALGRQLILHPEARELITERCRDMAREGKGSADMTLPENRQRLKMGEFPEGARIIPNPFNRIPGFAVDDHYFVPGFPVMAWPMIESVLDTHYAYLFHRQAWSEKSLWAFELAESAATPLLEAIEHDFPGLKTFSLPSAGHAEARRHVELGVKGDPAMVEPAFARLLDGVRRFDVEFTLSEPRRNNGH
ncbi:MAG: molybdopterin-binding protein [Burkholderiaceae bacterium]